MILVVDHHDSFVFNLVQLVEGLGFEVRVIRTDAATGRELACMDPEAVILSPGPGRPEDAGCMPELLRALNPKTPLLGVCLGHQVLGVAFGARVDRSPEPVHGSASLIYHEGRGILGGIASPFPAARYHSLVVERRGLPRDFEIIAETGDGLIMGIRHRRLPWFGVQFHPESILTPEGPRIVRNFLSLVQSTRAPSLSAARLSLGG